MLQNDKPSAVRANSLVAGVCLCRNTDTKIAIFYIIILRSHWATCAFFINDNLLLSARSLYAYSNILKYSISLLYKLSDSRSYGGFHSEKIVRSGSHFEANVIIWKRLYIKTKMSYTRFRFIIIRKYVKLSFYILYLRASYDPVSRPFMDNNYYCFLRQKKKKEPS